MSIADKLIQIAENVPKVYAAGQSAGVQTEYDRFWDAHPTAKGYCTGENLFGGAGWNDITFKPKYDIILGNCYMAFKACAVKDIVERLKECGVSLDLSRATGFYYCFTGSKITHLGVIYLTHANFTVGNTQLMSAFDSCYFLHTIDKIVLNDAGTVNFHTSTFNRCDTLANITFEGIIGTSINFQWCPLTKASITNIVEHLSSTATGQKLTLNLSAVNTAFETSAGAKDGSTSAEFAALVATKTNWTITMI